MESQENHMTSITSHLLKAALNLHHVPRFGHASDFSLLASTDRDERMDYLKGIVAFAFFLFMLLGGWMVMILALKCLGKEKVGCAAGGHEIDIDVLRKDKEMKPILRKMIYRSWRVQGFFFVAVVFLPVPTILLLRNGLITFHNSLMETQTINEEVEKVAYRALAITESLSESNVKLAAVSHQMVDLHTFCTTASANNRTFHQLTGASAFKDDIRTTLSGLNEFMENEVASANDGLTKARSATNYLDRAVDWAIRHEWYCKLFVLFINVINVAFLFGHCLARNDIVLYPFKYMLSYLLLPAFILMVIISLLATCAFAAFVVINADFCSGGPMPGSPQGTMEEIIVNHGNPQRDMTYQFFRYYMDGCTTIDNPLESIVLNGPQMEALIDSVKDFLEGVDDYGMDKMTAECGRDIRPVATNLRHLLQSLTAIRVTIQNALALSSCSTVSPILRRIFFGVTCDESVLGASFLFGSFLCTTIVGLVVLSLRAALFNATLQDSKKKKKNASELEWREYQEYMSQYFDDAYVWMYHPSPMKRGPLIAEAPSFDTALSTNPSSEDTSSRGSPVGFGHGNYNNNHDRDGEPDVESFFTMVPTDFSTPKKRKKNSRASSVQTMLHVSDEELIPLSPDAPNAPKKMLRNFRRTGRGEVLC